MPNKTRKEGDLKKHSYNKLTPSEHILNLLSSGVLGRIEAR